MKLVVYEQDSEVALSLFEGASRLVSASLGYVEARSALSRLSHEGHLRGTWRDRAPAELERIWRAVDVVQLDDGIVHGAGDVADLLRLRAGNAIHLASALAVAGPELVLATWDAELREAAVDAGLAVAP